MYASDEAVTPPRGQEPRTPIESDTRSAAVGVGPLGPRSPHVRGAEDPRSSGDSVAASPVWASCGRRQLHIGRELHDGVGQQLTGIALMSDLLEKKLAARGQPEAEDARRIARYLRQALEDVRTLSHNADRIDLGPDGLAGRLESLADAVSEQSLAQCTIDVDEDAITLDRHLATNLYRITQEAVSNALRHGRASNIRILLCRRDGMLTLSIEDDGVGLDPVASDVAGMGLQTMRFRAELIHGSFRIRRRRRGGTVVTCSTTIRETSACTATIP